MDVRRPFHQLKSLKLGRIVSYQKLR